MANAWESAPLANSAPATGAPPPAGGTPAWQSAPLANPPATSIMDNNGLLGRMDAAIGGPGNTIRKPIQDVANWANALVPWSTQNLAAPPDDRPVLRRAADAVAGGAGMMGVTGDTLRTLGAPGAAQALDTRQQEFQAHNGPQLQAVNEISQGLMGVDPAVAHTPEIRVPTAESLAARVSPTLGEGVATARDPAAAGVRDLGRAARQDGRDATAVYNAMTPQAGNNPKALPQVVINQIIDHHAAGVPVAEIADKVGASPATVSAYIARFRNEIEPTYGGQNLAETLRTPMNGEQVVSTPNLRRVTYDAANMEGPGGAELEGAVAQRKADQQPLIEGLVDQHFGSENFDQQKAALLDAHSAEAKQRYADLYDSNPDLLITKQQLGPVADDPLFQKAADFAQRDAAARGEPFQAGYDHYTPRAMDLIQRQLRIAGETISDPNVAQLARALREHVLNVSDDAMQGFTGTRGWYRSTKEAEDAADAGRSLGLTKGNSGAEEWQAFLANQAKAEAADGLVKKLSALVDKANKSDDADPVQLAKFTQQLADAKAAAAPLGKTRDWFVKSFGQGIKDKLNKPESANGVLRDLRGREARSRVMQVLGPQKGKSFLDRIDSENRKTASERELYGNSQTAPRTRYQAKVNAAGNLAMGIVSLPINPIGSLHRIANATTDLANYKWQQRRADAVNRANVPMDALQVRAALKTLTPPPKRGALVHVPSDRAAAVAQTLGAAGLNATQPRGFAAGAQ